MSQSAAPVKPAGPPAGVCHYCRSDMPPDALICLKCKSAHGWYFWHKLGMRVLTLVAIPVIAWVVTQIWESGQRSQLQAEERRRDENRAVETLMKQLETSLAVTDSLLAARLSLEQGCAHGLLHGGTTPSDQGCATSYLGALTGMDLALNRLAWQVDSLAMISGDTYGRLKSVKSEYWKSCKDDQPFGACGWRQRAIRNIYGFGLPISATGHTALMRCHPGRSDGADEGCRTASERMRQEVTQPLEQEVSLFFCSYVMDLNGLRMEIFRERAREVGSDSAYARLVDRLGRNMQNSTCAERLRAGSGPGSSPAS